MSISEPAILCRLLDMNRPSEPHWYLERYADLARDLEGVAD